MPDASNLFHSGTGGYSECHWCTSAGWLSGTHGDSAAAGQFLVLPTGFAHHCQRGEAAASVVDLGLPGVVLPRLTGSIPHRLPKPSTTGFSSSGNHASPARFWSSFLNTLQELVGNRIQLNRLLGLSNLYYIDPEDQEILHELRDVRLA